MGKSEPPCHSCPKHLGLDPANELAWELFVTLLTQPRVAGMSSVMGADLALLPVLFDLKEVPKEDRPFLLDKICILNSIGLRYWNKKDDTAQV